MEQTVRLLRTFAKQAAAAADALERGLERGEESAAVDSPVWQRLSHDLALVTNALRRSSGSENDAPVPPAALHLAPAEARRQRGDAPDAPPDLARRAPRIAAHLERAGVRVVSLEAAAPEVERVLLDLGDRLWRAIQRWPLTLAIMDAVKLSLNPPPSRARRMVLLRRQARVSVEEIAARIGRTAEDVRRFEHTGRGLSASEVARVEVWLGRLADGRDPGALAMRLGLSEAEYLQYERGDGALSAEQRDALESWLTRQAMVIGAPLYGAAPMRRLAWRYGVGWEGVRRQMRPVCDEVVTPLIDAGLLDAVRVSRIGAVEADLELPDALWTPEPGRAPPGAPTPDLLLHLWVAPHPLVKRFLTGQWLTYAVLARIRALKSGGDLEALHDVVVTLPLSGGERRTAVSLIAAVPGGLAAVETISLRQREQVRQAVRRAAEVLECIAVDPRRRIAVVLAADALGDATRWGPLTVVAPPALDAALEAALDAAAP